ncbi:unnamed protein product [Prunus armeniaca]|uniref:Uncharacterized protein n=1 Tax=Prunus armeniaca TaxID=36596 RepID=A0A6J5XHL6_PRUAR|nr:unnamed protein product [Prunus armeniaca]
MPLSSQCCTAPFGDEVCPSSPLLLFRAATSVSPLPWFLLAGLILYLRFEPVLVVPVVLLVRLFTSPSCGVVTT